MEKTKGSDFLSRKKTSLWLSLLIVVGVAIASSESSETTWRQLSFFPIQGLDATVKWGGQNGSCFEYRDYTILEKQNMEESTILVKAPVKCVDLKSDDLSKAEIFQFKGNHVYFLGMYGNLLFVDSSAAPGSKGLKILNVSTKKQVYEGSYSQPLVVEKGKARFWVKSDVEATRENCRDFGLRPKMVIETLSFLDLTSFKMDATDKARCEPREQ